MDTASGAADMATSCSFVIPPPETYPIAKQESAGVRPSQPPARLAAGRPDRRAPAKPGAARDQGRLARGRLWLEQRNRAGAGQGNPRVGAPAFPEGPAPAGELAAQAFFRKQVF